MPQQAHRGQQLEVEFIDDVRTIDPGTSLSFGRQGDLIIDEANPFLHRIVGEFVFELGAWRLVNRGSRTMIYLVAEGGSRMEVTSGGTIPVPLGLSRILVEAGSARYVLHCAQGADATPSIPRLPPDGETTADWGSIPLNYEQTRLLVALCESELVESGLHVPSNKTLAGRLGWSLKKVERKFDYLCRRYSDAGVTGLRGGAGFDATDRRRRLAEHVLRQRIVTDADLMILDVTDRP